MSHILLQDRFLKVELLCKMYSIVYVFSSFLSEDFPYKKNIYFSLSIPIKKIVPMCLKLSKIYSNLHKT